jgi:DNA polymerase elongation subunit (family B)
MFLQLVRPLTHAIFPVTLHKTDPNIIVGRDFVGVSLDILLHRMGDLKTDHWSRIGRFRRTKWPEIGRQGTNLRFLNGRSVCDLASDGAKSMISSIRWSLTGMCSTHLKSARQDIDPEDTPSYFDDSVSTSDRLITFVRHCELDAHYQMAIAAKVQILPLTRQLTNLAGDSWCVIPSQILSKGSERLLQEQDLEWRARRTQRMRPFARVPSFKVHMPRQTVGKEGRPSQSRARRGWRGW